MTTIDPPVSRPTPPVRRGVRARYVVATVVCVGVVVWLLIGGLAKNIVYLRPVSYAVAHRSEQGTKTFRMAGQVEPDSIQDRSQGGTRFVMTDGTATAAVTLLSSAPEQFQNCTPVVVEGHWDGATFLGDRLLIRHGAEYSASKKEQAAIAAAEKKNKKCPAAQP